MIIDGILRGGYTIEEIASTSQELKENPRIAILHPHDRCIIEPLSRNRGAERYANRSNK